MSVATAARPHGTRANVAARLERAALVAAAVVALVAGVLEALAATRSLVLSDISWTAAGAFAVVGLARARRSSSPADRRAWTYLLAATGAWLVGQVAWDMTPLIGSPPAPAPADICWLAFPVIAAVGTYRLVPLSPHARLVARLEAVPLLVAVGTIVWLWLHDNFAASALDPAGRITALAYAVLYLALPIVMLQGLVGGPVRLRGNRDLLLVLAGLATEAVAFILWSSQLLDGTYLSGQRLLDVLWTAGMLAIGAGALQHRARASCEEAEPRFAALLPALTFLAVLGSLMMAAADHEPLHVRLALMGGLLGIGGTLMARSAVLSREQQRLLAEQRAAHEALRRARAASARFFELSHDLLCTADLEGRLVDVNPAWTETLGHEPAELVGQRYVDLVHPEDRAPTGEAQQTLARGDGSPDLFHNRYRTKDGEYRWISWSTRVDLEDGLVYARGTDITDRRFAEDERRRAAARLAAAHDELAEKATELERSNDELEQFAYVASHDLAEPLRSISGFSQFLVLEYGDRLDDDGREYLEHISSGVTRMRALIDGLLEYSRVGRVRPALAPVRSGDVLDDVLSSLQAAIAESDVRITCGALPVVAADRRELARVLQNLIANAIKFSDGEAPAIRVDAERDGLMWRFSVIDHGIGIEPQYAERVFGMFKRLHDRDRYPGTGIGLTIAKRVVERHAGRIWVTPTPGGGSTFNFTLKPATEVAT